MIDAVTGAGQKPVRVGDLVDGAAAVSPNGLLVYGAFDGVIYARE